ncbi:MAG: branched-chain amino acid transport system substrate-binding protein [Natronomonas sp.]|jgi:branched-chain amino acid transport system substrate-binding protein|uniref:ABC transporter substrate-binding protein n=1 Tax=Natronomonas sp. TaxID=2184060 RepID=UPI0039897857
MVNNDKRSRQSDSSRTGAPFGVGRRSFLKATGAGAVGTALAGCLGGDNGSGDGSGIPDTVTLGALGPADSPMGDSILKSAELAISEINDNGGIGGADVELSTKDTKDDPGTTRQVYQELTTGENVDATVGIFGSENLLSIMQNIAQAETVHMTAGAATPEAPRIVKDDYETNKHWFRVGPVNSVYLGESEIEFAKDYFEQMGWETVAFIAEDYKWTEPITNTIKSRLEDEVGVEVTEVRRVSEGTEDFTPIYDDLESANVDGAYTALAHIGTTALVQWAKQQRPFGFGGIHVPTQLPSYYEATEGAAISTFSQTTATPTSAVTEKTVPYANAYQEEYGGSPVYTGYSAYDAVYILKEAIESTESVSGSDLIPELEGGSYTGTGGTIEFGGPDSEFPHDVKYGPELSQGVYFQWQQEDGEGRQKVLWPDDLKEAEYMSPPWV